MELMRLCPIISAYEYKVQYSLMKISIKKLLRNTFFPSYAHTSTCLLTPNTHTHTDTHMFEFSEEEERSSI